MWFPDPDKSRSCFRLLFLFSIYDTDVVSDEERFLEALSQITLGVKIPEEAIDKLRSIFYESLQSEDTALQLAREVARDFSHQREVLTFVLSIILRISQDEGILYAADRARIKEVCVEFAIDAEDLAVLTELERNVLEHVLGPDTLLTISPELKGCYKALGCSPEMPMDEISRRYRKLAMHLHPDRAAITGENYDNSEEFRKIKRAYDSIQKVRGLAK